MSREEELRPPSAPAPIVSKHSGTFDAECADELAGHLIDVHNIREDLADLLLRGGISEREFIARIDARVDSILDAEREAARERLRSPG
jgi:hypothetical protein